MTAEEIQIKLQKGYEEYKLGNTRLAEEAFAEFRENHY